MQDQNPKTGVGDVNLMAAVKWPLCGNDPATHRLITSFLQLLSFIGTGIALEPTASLWQQPKS